MQRIAGIGAARLAEFTAQETARYVAVRPLSAAAAQGEDWLGGVPMHWMTDWPQPFALVVAKAKGALLRDLDGHAIDDFCLGDTGSMFGHSPKPVAEAVARQAARGLTYMLPSQDTQAVGRLLSERFGAFRWQVATTATDANRCAIKVARAVSGRPKILVFIGSYHGTVDEVMVTRRGRRTVARPGLVGRVQNLGRGAVCVEFNDLDAVAQALAKGDVAAVLTEPVMTNCAMVLPARGFLQGLRALCSDTGTALIIDETHTLSSGLGGYARGHGIVPDIFVAGKAVAGGVACAVWGLSAPLADRFAELREGAEGHSGMGTTLSGNPLQFAALRANLAEVMTAKAYARMEAGALRLEAGLTGVIARHRLPWHVVRVGARVEFICAPGPLLSGAQALRAHVPQVERALHLGLLNRGCLIAPFHNMMLVSPKTEAAQVGRLINAFDAVLDALMGERRGPMPGAMSEIG